MLRSASCADIDCRAPIRDMLGPGTVVSGIDRADVRLDDAGLIDWRGGGAYEWNPSG